MRVGNSPLHFLMFVKWVYQLQIQQLRVGNITLPVIPLKKGETYETQEIVNHIKILPKRSKERAAAMSTVIESGDAKDSRTKIYECLNKAERDAAWVADTETIAKSKEPVDTMNLGTQNEGIHIEPGLHDKDLK